MKMANPKFIIGAVLVGVGVIVIGGMVFDLIWKAVFIALAIAAIYTGFRIMTKSTFKRKESDKADH